MAAFAAMTGICIVFGYVLELYPQIVAEVIIGLITSLFYDFLKTATTCLRNLMYYNHLVIGCSS